MFLNFGNFSASMFLSKTFLQKKECKTKTKVHMKRITEYAAGQNSFNYVKRLSYNIDFFLSGYRLFAMFLQFIKGRKDLF